jgi:hypothetical protein
VRQSVSSPSLEALIQPSQFKISPCVLSFLPCSPNTVLLLLVNPPLLGMCLSLDLCVAAI